VAPGNTSEKIMNIRILLVASCMALAAGCSTASGPTHNTDILKLQSGAQVYRVQCQGLFESSKTCVRQAEKVCGDKTVREISSMRPATADGKPEADPREMTFTCEAPVAH
jgi:OmpA-OmpF porin, OOP family